MDNCIWSGLGIVFSKMRWQLTPIYHHTTCQNSFIPCTENYFLQAVQAHSSSGGRAFTTCGEGLLFKGQARYWATSHSLSSATDVADSVADKQL